MNNLDNNEPTTKLLPGPGRPKGVKTGQGRKFRKSKGNGNGKDLPKIYEDDADRLFSAGPIQLKDKIKARYQLEFMRHYANSANITLSARHIGVTRRTIYDWMAADPVFKAAIENGKEEGIDLLEAEIKRRGYDGYEQERVTTKGEVVAVKQYSDNLAMFLLKGERPEKYRDNYPVNLAPIQINVNLGTPGDVRINTVECDVEAISAWQKRQKSVARE